MARGKRVLLSRPRLSAKVAAIIALIIILGSEYIVRDAFISKGASRSQVGIALAVEWVIALFLLLHWIPKVEHRSLGSVGFRKFPLKYLWISVVAYIVYVLISYGVELGLKAAGLQSLRDLSPTLKGYGFPLLFGLFLTGTLVEEVFYRGYLIERVTELTGRRWVAAVVSWAAFTLVHLQFFGLGPTMEVAVIGAIFVTLYMAAKSIWPVMIVHGMNDAIGFLIGPFTS